MKYSLVLGPRSQSYVYETMSNFNTCISTKNVLYLDVLQCRRRHGGSIRPARYLCVNSKAKGDETTGAFNCSSRLGGYFGDVFCVGILDCTLTVL